MLPFDGFLIAVGAVIAGGTLFFLRIPLTQLVLFLRRQLRQGISDVQRTVREDEAPPPARPKS